MWHLYELNELFDILFLFIVKELFAINQSHWGWVWFNDEYAFSVELFLHPNNFRFISFVFVADKKQLEKLACSKRIVFIDMLLESCHAVVDIAFRVWCKYIDIVSRWLAFFSLVGKAWMKLNRNDLQKKKKKSCQMNNIKVTRLFIYLSASVVCRVKSIFCFA